MNNRIYDAFSEVKADKRLKQNTLYYLQNAKKEKSMAFFRKRYGYYFAAAACLLLFFVGTAGYSLWRRPVSYISVDVNPSFELELNRFDRVVETHAYNEEGQSILENVSVDGKVYTDAIEMLLRSSDMQEYLDRNGLVEFAVASRIRKKEAGLESGIERISGTALYQSNCAVTDIPTVEKAHDNHISVGKYLVYQQLCQYDDTITVEECRRHSMSELHDLLSEHSRSHYGNGNGSTGNGHGHGHHGHGHE